MGRRLQVTQSCPLLAVGAAAAPDDGPVGGGEPEEPGGDGRAIEAPELDGRVLELDGRVLELDGRVLELDGRVLELDGRAGGGATFAPPTSDSECARRRFRLGWGSTGGVAEIRAADAEDGSAAV